MTPIKLYGTVNDSHNNDLFPLLFPRFCVTLTFSPIWSLELYIFSLLSAANQLRRGKVENVCRSEKETPAVLLEGQRVPRAAGKNEYVWDVTHCSMIQIFFFPTIGHI